MVSAPAAQASFASLHPPYAAGSSPATRFPHSAACRALAPLLLPGGIGGMAGAPRRAFPQRLGKTVALAWQPAAASAA